MSRFKLAFSNGSLIIPPDEPIIPDVPEIQDLVTLGILQKQVSEFTNDDIGTIVSIPYNDESGNITGPIEFEVVGINHHKDINDESKPTITLMTKNIIRCAAFDARESNNPDSNRVSKGNSRWSVSNIRQWLNSSRAANEWFTSQHEYDVAPSVDKVVNEAGAYIDDPGFLAGFDSKLIPHFATVRNKTILCNADRLALSKDFEETEDKVFLPSYTEMGFGNLDSNNPEGTHLAQKFTDDDSKSKDGAGCYDYWMRSPDPDFTIYVYIAYNDSTTDSDRVDYCEYGIAPLIVLC
jgi:hypothetical protein